MAHKLWPIMQKFASYESSLDYESSLWWYIGKNTVCPFFCVKMESKAGENSFYPHANWKIWNGSRYFCQNVWVRGIIIFFHQLLSVVVLTDENSYIWKRILSNLEIDHTNFLFVYWGNYKFNYVQLELIIRTYG